MILKACGAIDYSEKTGTCAFRFNATSDDNKMFAICENKGIILKK